MNVYTIIGLAGQHQDVEADFYETEDSQYVFYADGAEMLRVPVAETAGVTKAPKEPPAPEGSPGLLKGL